MRPKVNFKPEAWVKLSELRPHPKNPRVDLRLDEGKFSSLKKSIEEGVFEPVKISKKTGYCLAGNQRLKAFEDLGFDEVPVMFNECENEHEEMQVLLKDNNEWGAYDFGVLAGLVAEIDLDISNMGFSEDDLKQLSKEDKQRDKDMIEDDVPAIPEEPKAKLGDIYQLGRHRLMCGDSTSLEAVAKLMNGQKADMVFIDPPYGIGISSNPIRQAHEKFEWDREPPSADYFTNLLKVGEKQIIWGGNYFALPPTQCFLIWDKKQPEDFSLAMCEMAWTNIKMPAKMFRLAVTSYRKEHPTQKPVELIVWAMDVSCGGKVVIDPFGGSGSTLIACEKTERTCFMMELEPKYIDVIVQRWEEYTGEKALKIA